MPSASTPSPPGMVDVAKLAGVSHQTVSRVLNASPAVRPATRERVEAAIATLGYRRNSAARALASRRSGIIGVVSMESTLHGPASTLHGIERAARAAGYFVSVTAVDGHDPGAIDAAVQRLAEQDAEGVVVIAPLVGRADPLVADVPVVLTQGAAAGTPTVALDQRRGAALATEHLLERRARTVWHVAGPAGWVEADQRIAGWHDALVAAGADVPEPLRGDWSPAAGYRIGTRLAANRSVDAVFVANDHMALGLLRALAEAGRRVPHDVLVAGFDDIPEAPYFTPPLTSVRQDFLEIGRRAIDLLIRRIQGASDAAGSVLEPELVARASSQPAAQTK